MTCAECKAEEINRRIALEVRLQELVNTACKLHNAVASLVEEFGRLKQFYHEKGIYSGGRENGGS